MLATQLLPVHQNHIWHVPHDLNLIDRGGPEYIVYIGVTVFLSNLS